MGLEPTTSTLRTSRTPLRSPAQTRVDADQARHLTYRAQPLVTVHYRLYWHDSGATDTGAGPQNMGRQPLATACVPSGSSGQREPSSTGLEEQVTQRQVVDLRPSRQTAARDDRREGEVTLTGRASLGVVELFT